MVKKNLPANIARKKRKKKQNQRKWDCVIVANIIAPQL